MNSLVFDIDLDRFVEPTVLGSEKDFRPSSEEHEVWERKRLDSFFQDCLGLSSENPLPGACFKRHDELYHFLEEEISNGRIHPPFDWLHIDGHDDIGGLASAPLSPANFLLHCIKRGWIETLIFSMPGMWGDIGGYYFRKDPPRLVVEGVEVKIDVYETEQLIVERSPDLLFITLSPSYSPVELDDFFEKCHSLIKPS